MSDYEITSLINNIVYWATKGYTKNTSVVLHKLPHKNKLIISSPHKKEIEKVIEVFGLSYVLYHESHSNYHIFVEMERLFG